MLSLTEIFWLTVAAVLLIVFTWTLEGRPGWRRRAERWSDYCFQDSHEPLDTDMSELLAPPTPREALYMAQRNEWKLIATMYYDALTEIACMEGIDRQKRAFSALRLAPMPKDQP